MDTPKRIIHVDDTDAWRFTVRRALKVAGYEVLSFSHVSDARACLAGGDQVALIICDVEIDEEADGLAWAHELHAASHQVLMLSGSDFGDLPGLSKYQFDDEVFVARVAEMVQT